MRINEIVSRCSEDDLLIIENENVHSYTWGGNRSCVIELLDDISDKCAHENLIYNNCEYRKLVVAYCIAKSSNCSDYHRRHNRMHRTYRRQ